MTLVHKRLFNLVGLMTVGGVAGFLLFWQIGALERREAEQQEHKRIIGLKAADVTRVELESSTAQYTVVRENDGWLITSPLSTVAEKSTLDGMVRYLADLKRIRQVGEKGEDGEIHSPTDLWMFGLETPRFIVRLTDVNGAVVELRVGKKNTFDGSIYVKRSDRDDVDQVDGALEYQINKDLYQLRDKRLLAFDEAAVQRIEVTLATGGHYTLERQKEDFRLRAPRDLPADRAQVSGMISALANVRAKAFLSEMAARKEKARYGLDKPTARVTLTVGSEKEVLLMSRQTVAGQSSYYAMREGNHPILELGSEWVLKKFLVSADELRDKRVLPFDQNAVGGLTLSRGDVSLSFVKQSEEGGDRDHWFLRQPQATRVQDATLTGILYRLANLKAKRVVHEWASPAQLEEAGLAEPDMSIELEGEGTLLFSKASNGERFVTTSEHRRIDVVDTSIVDDISMEPTDYLEANNENEGS